MASAFSTSPAVGAWPPEPDPRRAVLLLFTTHRRATGTTRPWDVRPASPERFSRSTDRQAVTAMDIALTIAAFLVLIAGGAYVIHRLNSAHGERIALHSYSRFLPGRPAAGRAAGTTAPPPPPSAPAPEHERRDHRDGGRGRFRPRRHRNRTTHNKPNAAGR